MWATELFVTPAFCEGHGHPSTEGHGRPPVVASQPPDEKACAGHALRTPSGRNDFYRGPAQRLVCAEKAQTAFGALRPRSLWRRYCVPVYVTQWVVQCSLLARRSRARACACARYAFYM